MERTFEEFAKEVRESCEKHAQRKNYTTSGINGPNQLMNVCVELGIHDQHSIGEIIYKCAEYLKTPKDLLLVKIAGWAFVMWKSRRQEEPPLQATAECQIGTRMAKIEKQAGWNVPPHYKDCGV